MNTQYYGDNLEILKKRMPSGKIDLYYTAPQFSFMENQHAIIQNSMTKQIYPRSPLRYPGGKSRGVKYILPLIPENVNNLCSPFLGGGSIELAATLRMKVKGYDIFGPLIDFWNELVNNPNKLADQVANYFPLEKSLFYQLQKEFLDEPDHRTRAAKFYVLNRSSYSGTTLSGGMSPNHPRFTISSIERLREFSVQDFEVECMDFHESIPRHAQDFLYLDPPYLIKQALYGYKGSTHNGFDHQGLYELLYKRDSWILSYNDCDEVRQTYKRYQIITPEWVYGMSKNKTSREILILSEDLPHVSFTK
jgi:DNA adenine methylase